MNLPKSLQVVLNVQENDGLVFRMIAEGVAEVVSASTLARRVRGMFVHLKAEESETDTFLAERRAE